MPSPTEEPVLDALTRQVLVNLIKGPSIDGVRQTNLWGGLTRNLELVKSRLAELYLELVVDHDQKIAFCRQIDEEESHPILLRRARLTFIQSALVLYLRGQLSQAETRGERAVVSDRDMNDFMAVYRRAGDQDHAKFSKACQGAIDKLKSYSILHGLEDTDRFEINPALKLIFSSDQIRALENAYQGHLEDGDEPEEEDE